LYDVLNSVANLTNSDGAVQARYQYDAWGIKRNQVGTSYNRFSFTGYEEDKETGLLYAKARYYDPDTGKFLSEDAWEGDNMIAPSLHRYLYGYQNPTVYVDLDGNFPVTQQVRDFFRNQAANQARTSRDLTASLGDGFFSDVGVRSLNAASGIGNALFSVAGEAVNLVDLGLDSGVGSSRMLSNTKVGQESRARVKGTREFLKNTAKTAASKTQAAVKEKGFIGATGDAIGSSASKTGNFLHKAYIEGDLDAGAKLSGGLYTGAVPVAGASKLLGRGRRGSSNDSTTGQKADIVGESSSKVVPEVPNSGTRGGATDAEAGDLIRRNDGDRFDLQSHEGYRPPGSRSGGHLIDRHVGRTEDQLIARANGQNGQRAPLGGASSFSSNEAAQHFTSSTLKRNQADIQQWMQSNPGNRPQAFQSTFDSATGRHVPNRGSASSNVNGAKIILQKDATRSEGYRIITGHPVPVE
jgi:RHS repeat-associated protein